MSTGTSYEPPGSKSETVMLLGILVALIVAGFGVAWLIGWLFG